VWCARQGELTYAGARIVVAVSLALEAAVGVNLASARRAEEAAMFTVDGNVLETRSQARRGEEPVTVPRFEGEIDARDPIAIVEDHHCRRVVEQRDAAGLQPAAFLRPGAGGTASPRGSARVCGSYACAYLPCIALVAAHDRDLRLLSHNRLLGTPSFEIHVQEPARESYASFVRINQARLPG
jgi:hypothetical protein